MKYVQIGRFEIFLCKWEISYYRCHEGCKILSLGFFGFSWLVGDCV